MKHLLLLLSCLTFIGFTSNEAKAEVFEVVCGSEYNEYDHCEFPGFERARLVRQLSYTSCVNLRNFEFNAQGIHVWGGCKAVFEVTTRGGYGRPDYGNRRPDYGHGRPGNGRPDYGHGRPGNGRPGYGHGRPGNGRPGYGRPGNGRPGYGHGRNDRLETVIVVCESQDKRRDFCPVNGEVVDARILKRRSEASCHRGRGYQVDRDGITVNHGCRAKFEVTVRKKRNRR